GPNPFGDFIVVNGVDQEYTFQIFDARGQSVAYGKSIKNQISNLGDLSLGIYFLHILIGGELKQYKILKL
ncbi:MAG: T9SS type A sorting domain-containing protein, partial [Bacteroidetes bacterium]|nr:T9SS type A sorting domain-containing protein [Bacteroidota bacterium]